MTPKTEAQDSDTDGVGAPSSGHGKSRHSGGRLIVITLEGHLDRKWMDWLGAIRMAHERDGTTRLWVAIPDQPMLYGLLMRIRDLGMTLISIIPEDRR